MNGDAEQIAKALRAAATALRRELQRAERENLADAFAVAKRLSSGTVSTAELRRLKHPYARRRGRAILPPQVINRQTGEFFAGWRREGPRSQGGGLFSRIFNESPNAEFLAGGTQFMVERPLPAEVEGEIAPRVAARREVAIEVALWGALH